MWEWMVYWSCHPFPIYYYYLQLIYPTNRTVCLTTFFYDTCRRAEDTQQHSWGRTWRGIYFHPSLLAIFFLYWTMLWVENFMVHSCTCETLLRKRYDNINCIIFTAGIYDNILSSSFATPIRPSCMLTPVKLAAPVIVLSALECSKESSPHSICFGVSIHYIFIHNRILVQDRAMWFIAACHVLNSFFCLYLTCAPPLQTIHCRPASLQLRFLQLLLLRLLVHQSRHRWEGGKCDYGWNSIV